MHEVMFHVAVVSHPCLDFGFYADSVSLSHVYLSRLRGLGGHSKISNIVNVNGWGEGNMSK